MEKVKIYTAQWCPDCGMAKKVLNEKGIAYDEIDIEEQPETVDIIIEARGKRVLPTLEYQGNFIDGNHFRRDKFEADLKDLLSN